MHKHLSEKEIPEINVGQQSQRKNVSDSFKGTDLAQNSQTMREKVTKLNSKDDLINQPLHKSDAHSEKGRSNASRNSASQ